VVYLYTLEEEGSGQRDHRRERKCGCWMGLRRREERDKRLTEDTIVYQVKEDCAVGSRHVSILALLRRKWTIEVVLVMFSQVRIPWALGFS